MFKKSFVLFFMLFQFVSSVNAYQLDNYLTIQDLNRSGLNYGTYQLVGYVVKTYSCPECPKGSYCKPCAPDHITVSEERKEFDAGALTEKELIIMVDDTAQFKLKGKYLFLIQILDVKNQPQMSNNIRLIYSERID